MKRGLTLIEVLLATALLTFVAMACIPLLQSVPSMQKIKQADEESGPTMADLSRLADEVIDRPTDFGLPAFEDLSSATIAWPGRAQWLEVTIKLLSPLDGLGDHAWINFKCGELSTSRWVQWNAKTMNARER